MFINEANYPADTPKQVRSVLLAYSGKDLPLMANACNAFKEAIDLITDFLSELNSLDAMQAQLKQWISRKARAVSASSFFGGSSGKASTEISCL